MLSDISRGYYKPDLTTEIDLMRPMHTSDMKSDLNMLLVIWEENR